MRPFFKWQSFAQQLMKIPNLFTLHYTLHVWTLFNYGTEFDNPDFAFCPEYLACRARRGQKSLWGYALNFDKTNHFPLFVANLHLNKYAAHNAQLDLMVFRIILAKHRFSLFLCLHCASRCSKLKDLFDVFHFDRAPCDGVSRLNALTKAQKEVI